MLLRLRHRNSNNILRAGFLGFERQRVESWRIQQLGWRGGGTRRWLRCPSLADRNVFHKDLTTSATRPRSTAALLDRPLRGDFLVYSHVLDFCSTAAVLRNVSPWDVTLRSIM